MKNLIYAFLCLIPIVSYAHEMVDDPYVVMFNLDKFETSDWHDAEDVMWDAQLWVGQDLNKLWLKSEGERVDNQLEVAETQLLYSRAIAPYWDVQVGLRHDKHQAYKQDWLAVGLQGVAPYFFESELHGFINDEGNVNVRLKASYEGLITQKLILTPEIEANVFTQDDETHGMGAGLANAEFGLRLRYEINKRFAPYLGVNWSKAFAKTADISRNLGESTSDAEWVLGLKAWW